MQDTADAVADLLGVVNSLLKSSRMHGTALLCTASFLFESWKTTRKNSAKQRQQVVMESKYDSKEEVVSTPRRRFMQAKSLDAKVETEVEQETMKKVSSDFIASAFANAINQIQRIVPSPPHK